jgi:hypothetical protein
MLQPSEFATIGSIQAQNGHAATGLSGVEGYLNHSQILPKVKQTPDPHVFPSQ